MLVSGHGWRFFFLCLKGCRKKGSALDTDARKSETTVQRRDNWNVGEIRMLLDMWADDKIKESLDSSGRNIVVYRRTADRFNRALRYGEPGTDGLPQALGGLPAERGLQKTGKFIAFTGL